MSHLDSLRALLTGVKEHAELEEDSIEKANEILYNVWIREKKAIEEKFKNLRDYERRHHDTLKALGEDVFRLDPNDFNVIMRGS